MMAKPWEQDWSPEAAPTQATKAPATGKPWEMKWDGQAPVEEDGVVADIVRGVKSSAKRVGAFSGMLGVGLNETLREATGIDLDSLGEKIGLASTKKVAERAERLSKEAKEDAPKGIAGDIATIPAMLATLPAQPAMAASERYLDLTDKGVDKTKAAASAAGTFAVQSASVLLPIGRGLVKGALSGAGANVAGLIADKGFTNAVLSGDYDHVAKEYDINKEELFRSGVVGLILGGVVGKVTGGKGAPEAKTHVDSMFDDLATHDPAQAREVVENIKDTKTQAEYAQKLEDIVVSKPKQVKEIFEDAKSRGKGALAATEGDVTQIFNQAKKNKKELPPDASGIDVKDATMEEFNAAKEITPEVASKNLSDTMAKVDNEIKAPDAVIPGMEDPVVYFNAGIPVTKGQIKQAFQETRDVLRKSSVYRNLEKEVATSVDQVIRAVNPEALGPEAKSAASVIAKNVATQMQKDSSHYHNSQERRSFWNQRAEDVDGFISGFEQGRTFADPLMQKAAQHYKDWNERIFQQDQASGIKYEAKDNYLYHTFKDSEGVARFLEKRYGSKWKDPAFTKDRQFELYEEAKAAGFEPKFANPEDIMIARQHASDVAEMRVQTLRDMETYGLARKAGKSDADKIPGEIEWRAPNGERFYVNEDAAQVLHNAFNTKSLWNLEGMVGSGFRASMWAKNVVVPIKLALSLFHPIHVQTIDNATGMVRASKELLAGTMSPEKWLKSMGEAAIYKDIINSPKMGSRLLDVWKGKVADKDLTSSDRQALTYMLEGGFIPEMAAQYKIGAVEKFKEALEKGHKGAAAFQLPFAAIDALQAPMFQKWIPNLKAASYIHDIKTALKVDPSLLENPLKRQEAFRKIAKSVDNRYGEMAYNTLFWNRWIKDVGVASTLSLGWNLGFLREYGGGAMDLAGAVSGDGTIAHAAKKGQLDRPMFVAFYTAQALAYGGLMTWALTGQAPEKLIDYIYPKTGEKNPDGTDSRANTMFYPREFASIYKHMETEGALPGLGKLVANKATPLVGMVHDWATNVDYFGKEISDPDAPAYQRLQQKLGHVFSEMGPMSLSSVARSGKEPTAKDYALSITGFSPAPKYVTDSPTESKIKHIYGKYNQNVTPFQKAEYGDDARELRAAYIAGNDDKYNELIQKMEEKYELSPANVKALERNLNVEPTVKMFKRLTEDQQRKLLKDMTEDEVDKYLPHARKKVKGDF